MSTLHRLHGEHSLYCWQSLFTAPSPSNWCPIVPRVCFWGNVFSDPLPSNGHGEDHIENNSCNTFSIVACAYFGRCLELGLHVTIFSSSKTENLLNCWLTHRSYSTAAAKVSVAEHFSSDGNAADLYNRVVWFKSPPGHCCWLKIVISRHCTAEAYFKLSTNLSYHTLYYPAVILPMDASNLS
jgi:hypothetical protein